MREIDYIVIHCTATPQSASIQAIGRYWSESLGWKRPGYHIIVTPDGLPHRLAKDEEVCNGVKGYNARSLHISYIGGVTDKGTPTDNRTKQQKETLRNQVLIWKKQHPKAVVLGHRDFPLVQKACPSFDARVEYGLT